MRGRDWLPRYLLKQQVRLVRLPLIRRGVNHRENVLVSDYQPVLRICSLLEKEN